MKQDWSLGTKVDRGERKFFGGVGENNIWKMLKK